VLIIGGAHVQDSAAPRDAPQKADEAAPAISR